MRKFPCDPEVSESAGGFDGARAAQQRLARALAHELVVVPPEDVHEAAWRTPSAHMGYCECSHGALGVLTWGTPSAHMGYSECSHGVLRVLTWVYARTECSHGVLRVLTWVYARTEYSGALCAALRHRVTHRVYIACGLSLTTTPVVEYWLWCSESKRA